MGFIEDKLAAGWSKDQILDALNGTNNLKDLSRDQLERIGYTDTRIDTILSRQDAGLTTGRTGTTTGGATYSIPNEYDEQSSLTGTSPPYNSGMGTPVGMTPLPGTSVMGPGEDVTNDNLSAFRLFANILAAWGIPMGADIENIIRQAAIDGITPDMIELIVPDLQDTQTWRNRFPGWHSRVSNGYNQLSVGQYLQLENAYHRIMAEAGLPATFYDSPSDYGNWIANDVSPDEIRDRVGMAMDMVRRVDPVARDLLTKFYGVGPGDLASYFLDQKRAVPALERQYKAVNVAQWAAKNGLKVGDARHYEALVEAGVTDQAAAQGYGTVAAFNRAFGRIAGIYGEDYTQDDAEKDVFFNQNEKRRRLLSREVANFQGRSRGMTGSARRDTAY